MTTKVAVRRQMVNYIPFSLIYIVGLLQKEKFYSTTNLTIALEVLNVALFNFFKQILSIIPVLDMFLISSKDHPVIRNYKLLLLHVLKHTH
jgi:hypothetical protein